MAEERKPRIKVGWREWIALPELGIRQIKAKIDTGARTSAIHTDTIKVFHDSRGVLKVSFSLSPLPNKSKKQWCTAEVIDRRTVSDSGGHRELRWVIRTLIEMDGRHWPIEVTLTNRESMRYRMLLGRTALEKYCVIYPGRSYLTKNSKTTRKKKRS